MEPEAGTLEVNLVLPGVSKQLRRCADALEDLVKLLEASRTGRQGPLGLRCLPEAEMASEEPQNVFYHDRAEVEAEEQREQEEKELRLFGRVKSDKVGR